MKEISEPAGASGGSEPSGSDDGVRIIPPPQHNFQDAAARALSAVRAQPDEQLEWLGARRQADRWLLPALDDVLVVDPGDGAVRTSRGRTVGPWWQILTLHYLSASARPAAEPPKVTFADLPAGRAYAAVYRQRVTERLCGTVGRDRPSLARAGEELGGRAVAGGDLAFEFQVFPHLRARLIWYEGEDDDAPEGQARASEPVLPPSAVLLLPPNVEAFLSVEDIVVLSERIVSRLSGGRF